MAITCALTLATYGGLSLDAAYIKVAKATTQKVQTRTNSTEDETASYEDQLMVSYSASIFMDADAREANKNPLDSTSATFAWDIDTTPNILSACYADLKAQDTYAEATDC